MKLINGKVKRKEFPSHKLWNGNGAECNRVFLWENYDTSPYLRPVTGWEIIGFGKAPWPGSSNGFAAVFERIMPEDSDSNSMPEGTIIWQHISKRQYEEYVAAQ